MRPGNLPFIQGDDTAGRADNIAQIDSLTDYHDLRETLKVGRRQI